MLKKSLLALSLLGLIGCDEGSAEDPSPGSSSDGAITFTVTIENISEDAEVPTPFGPGLWVIHREGEPLFTVGEVDRGNGLETLAEDGSPANLLGSVEDEYEAGDFDAASDDYDEAAALPGEQFQFQITARPGDRLSVATMFVESNDYFAATPAEGIELFDGDEPVSGMIDFTIWDAGTEVDQPLGEGADQPMRQEDGNTGEAEDAPVSESELTAGDFIVMHLSPSE